MEHHNTPIYWPPTHTNSNVHGPVAVPGCLSQFGDGMSQVRSEWSIHMRLQLEMPQTNKHRVHKRQKHCLKIHWQRVLITKSNFNLGCDNRYIPRKIFYHRNCTLHSPQTCKSNNTAKLKVVYNFVVARLVHTPDPRQGNQNFEHPCLIASTQSTHRVKHKTSCFSPHSG